MVQESMAVTATPRKICQKEDGEITSNGRLLVWLRSSVALRWYSAITRNVSKVGPVITGNDGLLGCILPPRSTTVAGASRRGSERSETFRRKRTAFRACSSDWNGAASVPAAESSPCGAT